MANSALRLYPRAHQKKDIFPLVDLKRQVTYSDDSYCPAVEFTIVGAEAPRFVVTFEAAGT